MQRVEVEQGLLKTFGRVMPVGMSFCVVLGISSAVDGSVTRAWAWCAAGSFVAALVSTVIVNVPINRATGTWDVDHPPIDWQQARTRWEFFQGVRSWLLLTGFVLVCVASTA